MSGLIDRLKETFDLLVVTRDLNSYLLCQIDRCEWAVVRMALVVLLPEAVSSGNSQAMDPAAGESANDGVELITWKISDD